MSRSRVSVTEPSMLFSMATTPSSTIPEATPDPTPNTEGRGTSCASGS